MKKSEIFVWGAWRNLEKNEEKMRSFLGESLGGKIDRARFVSFQKFLGEIAGEIQKTDENFFKKSSGKIFGKKLKNFAEIFAEKKWKKGPGIFGISAEILREKISEV